jgi:DNA-binding response OmpR family regulator
MPPKETIVVADDDRVIVTLVADFLRKKGYNVFVAFDAMQAMLGARNNAPRAMILDVGMPGGTGVEVLKKMKTNNKMSQIPIIVLTGSTDPKTEEEMRALGADEFLTKPVNLPAVWAAVRRVLDLPPEPDAPSS